MIDVLHKFLLRPYLGFQPHFPTFANKREIERALRATMVFLLLDVIFFVMERKSEWMKAFVGHSTARSSVKNVSVHHDCFVCYHDMPRSESIQ